MEFPNDYKYSKEHTWFKLFDDQVALVGITEFAQSELGEIVYVDIHAFGKQFRKDEVFGSVEALKKTSDLFMPISGEVIEINTSLKDNATLVNDESYTDGWLIKIKPLDLLETESLIDPPAYQTLVS